MSLRALTIQTRRLRTCAQRIAMRTGTAQGGISKTPHREAAAIGYFAQHLRSALGNLP